MVKTWGRERFYISCNYSYTIFFTVKTLLVKNHYIQIDLNLSHEKRENVKVEQMVVFVKLFDCHKFN